jgi:hypothetical protein
MGLGGSTRLSNSAFYEVTRQRVEEMRQQQTKPEAPKPVYARGSVEWQQQQEALGKGDK